MLSCVIVISIFLIYSIMVIFALSKSLYVNEIPTGISYKVELDGVSLLKVKSYLLTRIKSLGFSLSRSSSDDSVWESRATKLSLNFDSQHNEANISVLTKINGSNDWQVIASQIDRILINYPSRVHVYIQRNPILYKCDPNCDFEVIFPAQFGYLNQHQLLISKPGN